MKVMKSLAALNSRDLVRQVNELKIAKEDIISIVERGDQFILFYYQ